MNALKQRIARLIEATGPISLAQYMHLALADPALGYYQARTAIGSGGDFVTAPEVSQMFGELIGVWAASAWQAMGSPAHFILAEAGPGRGTLMADALRAAKSLPGFAEAATIALIETSPAMIAAQKQLLSHHLDRIVWIDSLQRIEKAPVIFIANEFLDVLPFRQYVKADGHWRERLVTNGANGTLQSLLGPQPVATGILPPGHALEPEGSVFEHAPAREAFVSQLAQHLCDQGGAALLIDYGHSQSGFGDTFQAMQGHAPADPFAEPGMADLTSHVDFAALRAVAAHEAALVSPVVEQGTFLLAMGLAQRVARLCARKPAAAQTRVKADADRLAKPDQMGALFKVLALAGKRNASAMNPLLPFSTL